MVRRSVAEAAAAMDGAVIDALGRPAAGEAAARTFEGAALDSRRVRPGELFFALAGERTDGHRFVAPALAAGAAAAVVDREVETPAAVEPEPLLVRVADTFAALHDLTRAVRRTVPRRLVAITGSAGKTTTKELLAAMLARRYRTAKSPGNLNNLYGFPLALLGIPDGTEWMVAEMGMSTPGELRAISRLGRPDAAVFTNVRPVHVEQLGSLAAIARAKEELLEGLAAGGLVVANADDPEVAAIARRFLDRDPAGRVVWFGHLRGDGDGPPGPWLEVAATAIEPAPAGETGTRFTLVAGEPGARRRQPVRLRLHGRVNVDNALAAAACAWALGVPLTDVAAAAAVAAPADHRGVVHRLAGGATLIVDSYNSNPTALALALDDAAALPAARRWAVLGDMLELGPEAPRYHREAGAAAARAGFAPVAAVGEAARQLAAGCREAGGEAEWLPDAEAAAEWAAGRLRPGDVVLVKGSRGVGLEAVVASLLAAGGETGETDERGG